jgi:hypothetical protein
MADVRCKITKTGKPVFAACWVVIGDRQIDLTNSQKNPVPLSTGEYALLWEARGEIGEGIAIEVAVNGKVTATLTEQLIIRGNRIGSGSRPGSPTFNPLPFKV